MNRIEIKPQLAYLAKMKLVCYSPLGPIAIRGEGKLGNRKIELTLPENCIAELVVSSEEQLDFEQLETNADSARYEIKGGKTVQLELLHT